MRGLRAAGDCVTCSDVRRVGPGHARDAVSILHEAARWALERGIEVWALSELREADFAAAARLRQLVMGFDGGRAVSTMLLQPSDALYWPEIPAGTSLFLHKIAVRRAHAGQGWPASLVDFAVADARSLGAAWLRLDTIHGSPLRGIYEELGFGVVDEPPLTIGGRRMIRMERALCRST
ncbi:MAG TPA: GNAT family N-acetyltransferase [Steroidobacteraceae bacterium]|jgi:GNAT superfamily N-acetyltransferase|nr:GNAT family N-acetyltransferase [Steroidobacteraceae bacterium]